MARLLLPTRNRPTSLFGVLSYLELYYPGTELIIADGSTAEHQSQNAENVTQFENKLNIDYRAYPDDLSVLGRLVDVLATVSDDYFLMASDDDFPMIEVFEEGERFLRSNPEYSVAIGACIGLTMKEGGLINASFKPGRPIDSPCAAKRARDYSAWPFPTTYALTRRDVLEERFERAKTMFVSGFYDYVVGLHDLAIGAIKAFPTIGYVFTRNYQHSYVRPDDSLNFLRQSNVVLQIKDVLAQDILKYSDLDEVKTEKLATLLIKRRISYITGDLAYQKTGFSDSRYFQDPVVQQQLKTFHDMFTQGTKSRRFYEEKLMYIGQSMNKIVNSSDNAGEEKKYETLAAQIVTNEI